jgi:hypothetical protein
MMSLAFGRMKLTPLTFYSMSLGEFLLARKGWEDEKLDDIKKVRTVIHAMARLHGDPKKVPSDVTKFWPLPGDEEQQEAVESDAIRKAKERIALYKEKGII